MKLFLVGPKYDRPNSNFPEFQHKSEFWRNLGHSVVSSAELDVEEGAHPTKGWARELPATLVADFFRRDVSALMACDAVILMDGWDDDDHASMLAEVAEFCEMGAFEEISKDAYSEWGDDEYEYDDGKTAPIVSENDPYLAIFDELKALHLKKRADYGTDDDPIANYRAAEEAGIPTWVAIHVRNKDKMARLDNAAKGATLNFDSTEDDFKDIALMSILGLKAFREANDQ